MFDPFDLNKDGKMDAGEAFLKYQMTMGGSEEDLVDELEACGLDRYDLQMMDEDERRDILEEAGLDPDEFDELFD